MESAQSPAILIALLSLVLINAGLVLARTRAARDREKRLEELVAGGLGRAEAALRAGREVHAQYEAASLVTATVAALSGWWGIPLVSEWLRPSLAAFFPRAAGPAASVLALFIVVLVYLTLAHYIPERLAALPRSVKLLRSSALALYRVASPCLWLVHRAADALAKIARRPSAEGADAEGLPGPPGLLALASRGLGLAGATQREILRTYFDFKERSAGDIAIPLRDVASIASSMRIREARDAVRHFGFTRYPVYDGEPDRIIGVVHFRELVDGAETMPRAQVTDVMHSTITIPARTPASEALQAMQSRGCQMAVVADEHGATLGIITVEDILIELVLESASKPGGDSPPRSVEVGPGAYEIDAGLLVEEVEDLMDVDIDHAGFETIGSYVFERLGRKPKIGDTVAVDGLKFEAIDVRGARIRRLRVQRARGAPPPSKGASKA